jgi:hypothetical protein
MRPLVLAAGAPARALGCMEVEQASTPAQQAGQTVKRDTAPWNNEPLANGPKWTKGDRNSWEEQIKTRQLAQNERSRGRN